MLQRNTTDHPLDVPAIPATVQPGDTVDWPIPIVGFAPVAEPAQPVPDPVQPDPEPSPPKTARKQAAPAAAGEEQTR